MKNSSFYAVALANSIMWISCAIAILGTVKFTGNASALWAFVIPMFGGMSTHIETTESSDKED